jgi:GntR family transcriptional regulator, transcriptional repressor for pyruvate dehydrogenase complex
VTTKSRRPQLRTMPQLTAEDIRGQIVRGELQPGQALPSEKQLMETYGISRPTLRESMRILEAEALIEMQRGMKGGAVVRVPDPGVVVRQASLLLQLHGTTVLDVYTARLLFEPAAARLLADDGAVNGAELDLVLEQGLLAADDPPAFAKVAALFHGRLVELTGNVTMNLFAQVLARLTDATYALTVADRPARILKRRVELSLKSWQRLIELIKQGEGEAAERHWRLHMVEVGKYPGFSKTTAVVLCGD